MTYFIHGNPVPPERFIGRARELHDVINRLSPEGQSTALIGEPRCGKTSLIEYIQSPYVRTKIQSLSPRRLSFASVDAHNLVADFSQARFWGDVFEQVEASGLFDGAAVRLKDAWSACSKSEFQTNRVMGLLARLGESNQRLVVFIDELDYLVNRCVASHSEFFASLRSLVIGNHRALALVAASRVPIDNLNELTFKYASAGSPPFNIFHEVPVEPFSESDVEELLVAARDRFSSDDRRFIHRLSGGFPYLVQAAASFLWIAYEAGILDPNGRRGEAACALLRTATPMLNDIWRHWSSRVRYVFAAIAAEHLGSIGAETGWGASARPGGVAHVVDTETFRGEITTLKMAGFITVRNGTPSGLAIGPLIFLAWCAAKLRNHSQSTQLWTGWCQSEGWDAFLFSPRKQVWGEIIRERAKSVRTDVEVLLRADNSEPGAIITAHCSAPPSNSSSSAIPTAARRLRLFYMYAQADEPSCKQLDKHLSALRYEGVIETWWHHKVLPGDDYTDEINKNIESADIFVLLISADFLASNELFSTQLRQAMERRERCTAKVIPIRIRPADWGNLSLSSLEALPRNGRAVSQWKDPEEAWAQISDEIRRIIEEIPEMSVEPRSRL